MDKKYDLILFGVTGFTGKLAAEYLWQKQQQQQQASAAAGGGKKRSFTWAVSARNHAKAATVLQDLGIIIDKNSHVDILLADLTCPTSADREQLESYIKQTKVVLTCSGPFEKYGPVLVELCAQHGVHYADITGESDYFRQVIANHDQQAQASGAVILCHCGNDCIPCDLLVYELHQFANRLDCRLDTVMTYEEFSEEAEFSGGTVATAAYQLSKNRTQSGANPTFDPLLTTVSTIL